MNDERLNPIEAAARNLVFNTIGGAPVEVIDLMFADEEFAGHAREMAASLLAGPYGSFAPVDHDLDDWHSETEFEGSAVITLNGVLDLIDEKITTVPNRECGEVLVSYIKDLTADIEKWRDDHAQSLRDQGLEPPVREGPLPAPAQLDLFDAGTGDGLDAIRQLFAGLGLNVSIVDLRDLEPASR